MWGITGGGFSGTNLPGEGDSSGDILQTQFTILFVFLSSMMTSSFDYSTSYTKKI